MLNLKKNTLLTKWENNPALEFTNTKTYNYKINGRYFVFKIDLELIITQKEIILI